VSPTDLEVSALRALINLSTTTGGPAEATSALDATGCRAEDFAGRHLGAVFGLVETWVRSGRQPDLFGMLPALRPTVPSAQRFLAGLFMSEDTHLQPLERLRAVREAGRRRRASGALGVVDSLLGNPSAALTEAIAGLSRVVDDLQRDEIAGACTLEADVVPFCDRLDQIDRGEVPAVIPTGIEALDAVVGGHEAGILTFLGGLPSVGKGALIAAMLRNLGRGGVRCGLVSLEDPRRNLTARLVAEESGVPLFVLLKRRMTPHQKERVGAAFERVYPWLSNIDVDDRKPMDGAKVAAACRQLVVRGAKVVIVSNLTRIERTRSDRDDLEVQRVLLQLEAVAHNYGVTVIVDAHLKRRAGLELTTEASLDDFAFSAAIERCAKVALMLSRPGFGSDNDNTLRVLVGKQMNGKAGVAVDLEFDGPSGVVRNAPAGDKRAKVDALYRADERET
jgi:replicative DNA helicase